MNTKPALFTSSLVTAILFTGISLAPLRADEPWTDKELKAPAALAAALTDAKTPKPVIFNIGPVQEIKSAITIGPTGIQGNLDKLKLQLAKLPKDKEILIYCGCCPFSRCPNVRPAFELLKKMKFTNAKLLNLPNNLKDDWISKGYPME
jgi:thiosulfate/3-mercaptopyruvate sulfurtransferase